MDGKSSTFPHLFAWIWWISLNLPLSRDVVEMSMWFPRDFDPLTRCTIRLLRVSYQAKIPEDSHATDTADVDAMLPMLIATWHLSLASLPRRNHNIKCGEIYKKTASPPRLFEAKGLYVCCQSVCIYDSLYHCGIGLKLCVLTRFIKSFSPFWTLYSSLYHGRLSYWAQKVDLRGAFFYNTISCF